MIIKNQSETQFEYTLPDGSTHTETKESNVVKTDIFDDDFTKVKTSDKTYLQEGGIATQTVTYTNNTKYTIKNMFFKDNLSGGAEYVAGSVVINGIPHPTYTFNVGFDIGDLAPGDVTTVSYKIRANDPLTTTIISNSANLSYMIDERQFNEETNTVEITVVSNRLTLVKEVDRVIALRGETLHYTSTITNTGTLPKTNLTFIDHIPTGTTFVANSVKIDLAPQLGLNPQTGFAIPDLAAGESTVVEFDVTVN